MTTSSPDQRPLADVATVGDGLVPFRAEARFWIGRGQAPPRSSNSALPKSNSPARNTPASHRPADDASSAAADSAVSASRRSLSSCNLRVSGGRKVHSEARSAKAYRAVRRAGATRLWPSCRHPQGRVRKRPSALLAQAPYSRYAFEAPRSGLDACGDALTRRLRLDGALVWAAGSVAGNGRSRSARRRPRSDIR